MKQYSLANGVIIAPFAGLSEEQRKHIDANPTDFVITKLNSRERTRVVGADAAELLLSFKSPVSIGEAILTFAKSHSLSPEAVLSASFALLNELVKIEWLVDKDAVKSQNREPLFSIGSEIFGFLIEDVIQRLDDTEVYKGRSAEGIRVAIKVLLKDAPPVVVRAFKREQEILQALPATAPVPKLIEEGCVDGAAISVISWAEGQVASTVFHRIRRLQNRDYLSELLRIAASIGDAYASLHEAGVVHGDVHPRNLLVSESGQITIVDFGFSEGLNLKTHGATRNTIAFFEEPEYAAARLSGGSRPCATPLGEQYCVAAMLYFLLVGRHYVEFSYERETQSKQVFREDPLPFTTQGFVAWPELEIVLRRALSKQSEDRFPSMRVLADTLRGVDVPPVVAPASIPKEGRKLLANLPLLSHLVTVSPWSYALQAPTASPTYGAAGIAFALLRLSELLDDAGILSTADAWSLRALEEARQIEGLTNEQYGIDGSLIGIASLHHGMAGVHFVRALISRAQGDRVSGEEAIRNFIAAAQVTTSQLDLTLGTAGGLIGASILYKAFQQPQELMLCGDRIVSELETVMMAQTIGHSEGSLTFTGIAHGWAGFLLAILFWYQARGLALPSIVVTRLEELQEIAVDTGFSLKWPRKLSGLRPGRTEYLASWCNGSAGQVLLLSHTARVLQSDFYLEKAIQSAKDVMEAEDTMSDICCGLAGRAFCLASLYRVTGDTDWLNRGNSLIQTALKSRTFGNFPTWSLMKGQIGLELASLELSYSDRARFPLVESEWLD